jgi:hypothetical protein
MEQELLVLAETSTKESERVEFKRCFSPETIVGFWPEIVKDIVAMANTNGGVIIFGLEDDGTCSSEDVSSLLGFDVAKITDQIAKYTQTQFSSFFVFSITRSAKRLSAIGVFPARLPIVFTKPGTYAVDASTQKTAFGKGTVYFRHGAKSESADQNDIKDAFYRELSRVREEWFRNVRLVSEAEPGTQVVMVSPTAPFANVRLSDDPSAPAVRVRNLSETHPYRQSEAIKKIKQSAKSAGTMNSHDIQCVKLAENLNPDTRPDLVHRPHSLASPQYSEAFVQFVSEKIAANSNYLIECRAHHKKSKYGQA